MNKTREIELAELREQIAKDIEKAGLEMKEEAAQIGADAYLVSIRTTMACAAVARGQVK
jgi:uncharacterized protein YbjQ (UPF0145 family)